MSAQPDLRGLAERWKRRAESYGNGQLAEAADELLAALAGPEDGARSAWRPIGEYAHDGEKSVLVCEADGTVGEAFSFKRTRGISWCWMNGTSCKPTRFMPLPAPPVAAARPSGEQEGQ